MKIDPNCQIYITLKHCIRKIKIAFIFACKIWKKIIGFLRHKRSVLKKKITEEAT